jgi:predicted RNA-binding Zn-ribbon protein involved in translation (DUF1610 family)
MVVMPAQKAIRAEGRDVLVCRRCDAEFPEGAATKDGWHYVCPDCGEAEGIGDGLRLK